MPSGSFRVKVYAGTDPVTGKERLLKQICPDEASVGAALGKQWSASTRDIRDTAGKATAELQRRGQAQPDAGAVNGAGAGEPRAASNTAAPWSPHRVPDMYPPSTPRPELRTTPENEPAHQDQGARLGELLARAGPAAQRVAVHNAERQAGSQYAARMEREAQAGAGQQPEAQEELELEP